MHYEYSRRKLGDCIRTSRKLAGFNQQQVADRLKVPRSSISQIENGHRMIEAIELFQLAKVLSTPIEVFEMAVEED